jgi:hypothetical protein
VRTILTQLREANLTANVSKSEFCLKSMVVLGHLLEDGLIKMSPSKVQATLDPAKPKTMFGRYWVWQATIGLSSQT